MPHYCLYSLDRNGQRDCSIDVDGIDDEAALDFARIFFRHGARVEAWSGTRRVGQVAVPPSAMFWVVPTNRRADRQLDTTAMQYS